MSERFVAAQADIEWRANTGQVEADVEKLRREFRTSTQAMSDDTLKLTLAQEKLDKALARHGPASSQAKQAELALRREMKALEDQAERTEREISQLNRAQATTGRTTTGLRGRVAGLTSSVGALRGNLGFASGAFLGGTGFVYAMKQSISVASNLEEQLAKNRQVFGESSVSVERFARTTSASLGIARDQALETASSFGALLKPLQVVGDDAAKIAIELTQRGGDLASFYNTDVQSALDAIRSGLIGEAEPLRRYGALLSEARVQARAMADTGKDSAKALTDQEKAIARVNIILEDTVQVQGDAERTGGDYAGQMRRLNAQMRDLQGNVGELALPIVTDLVEIMNEGTGAANDFAGALGRLGSVSIPGASTSLGAIATQIFMNVGPYSTVTRIQQLAGLLGGDDNEEPGLGRAPHGRGGSVRGPALRAQQEAQRRRQEEARLFVELEEGLGEARLNQARASTTRGTADDERSAREERDLLQRQVRILESVARRKKLTDKQKELLREKYGELARAQAELDGIAADAEKKRSDQRKAAAEKREAEAERRRKAEQREYERAARRSEEHAKLLAQAEVGRHGWNRQGMRAAALAGVPEMRKRLDALQDRQARTTTTGGLTEADVRRMHVDFLNRWQSLQRDFGGNIELTDSAAGRGTRRTRSF